MSEKDSAQGTPPSWFLVSSHGLVLSYLATCADATIGAMSEALGLTPRRLVVIVKNLAQEGLIEVHKEGRRNRYRIREEAHFLHPTMAHIPIAGFVEMLKSGSDTGRKRSQRKSAGRSRSPD